MSGKKTNSVEGDQQSGMIQKRPLSSDDDESEDQEGASERNGEPGPEALRRQFHTNYEINGEGSVKRQKATLSALSSMAGLQGQGEQATAFNGTEIGGSQEKTVPFFAPKILRNDPQLQGEGYKYDKVIVDAECKSLFSRRDLKCGRNYQCFPFILLTSPPSPPNRLAL
jgi:hypothetical protein